MQHSQHCGAATGIFLLINASVIIIIRGHRFCLWGSVYLDAHGEEDRDLRYVSFTEMFYLLIMLFDSTFSRWTLISPNTKTVNLLGVHWKYLGKIHPHPLCALSAAVGSPCFYVKKGIACWSNSGFHTPLTTSINAGGLTTTDSKIFQCPRRHQPKMFFGCLVFFLCLGSCVCLDQKKKREKIGEMCLTQTWNEFIFYHSFGLHEVWCTIIPKD